MSKPPAIVRYSHENEVKQRTLDNKLRRFRIRVEEGEKEDHYLDHLLDILLNRFAHVLHQHSTLYFVAGYLNDAGFNISKSSIESRVRTQKRHKPFNYKPYLKINLDFITKYNTSIVHNDCLLKIYCVLKDGSGSKRVTKCLFQGPSARCYGQQKLYKTTFLSLKPWLEHIEIRTVVKPIRFTFASLVDLLLFRNRSKMTPVVLPPMSVMPLTGFKDCFEVFWRIKPNDYQICFSYNLEIEFCDHPKRVQCFRKQKLKIHKQLYLDTIKKYTNLDLVPQQVQSLIKLHGQQNQIATEEDRSILNEAISELDSLKVLQQEKLIRQQMRFFPKAPPPSPPPPDMPNHCGSTKKPPKGPPGFIPTSA